MAQLLVSLPCDGKVAGSSHTVNNKPWGGVPLMVRRLRIPTSAFARLRARVTLGMGVRQQIKIWSLYN